MQPPFRRVGASVGRVVRLSVLVIVGWGAGATAAEPPSPFQGARPTLDGAVGWINCDGPIHLEQLRGKIVLLDFWAYCCVNCHHVLPHLAALEKKYTSRTGRPVWWCRSAKCP